MHPIISAIISVAIAEAAGLIGSIFTMPAIPTWYAGLVKPSFSPPNWLFGPVWTTLYAFMGIAAFLVWRKRKSNPSANKALGIYAFQLILNSIWSFLFFGAQNPGLAFAEILVLLAAILWTTFAFYKIDRYAAYLMIPYIAWVSFATILNFSLWRLNS